MTTGRRAVAAVLAAVFLQTLLVQSVVASGGESGTVYNAGLDLGDPIMANSGQYHFNMPLLNLGGPLPLRFTLHHRTGGPSSEGFPWPGNLQHNLDPTVDWMPHDDTNRQTYVLGAALRNYEIAGFEWNAASNRWDADPAMPTRYTMHETGSSPSNGWYCLSDPLREHVYLFEKNPEMSFSDWSQSRVRYKMDRNYNRHTYLYNSDHQGVLITNVSDGLGRSFDFEYDEVVGRSLTGVVDQAGRRIGFIHESDPPDADVFDVVRSVVDAGGGTSTFHYTKVEWTAAIVAVDRPLGNTPYSQTYTQVVLNAETNVRATSQTDAYGNTTVIAYDAGANRVTETRADGATAVYEHFGDHAPLRSIQDEAGRSATFTRTAKTQTASVTDRLGDTTAACYHPVTGKITSYRDAAGNLYSNTYTAVDQVFTNPATGDMFTNTFYDLVRRDYPDGTHETYGSDWRGNVTVRVDRVGHTWRYTYNGRGQVLTLTNPDGGVVTYAYADQDATLVSRRDSDTGITTYAYDAHKRLEGITRPDGTSIGIGYDPNDRVTARTNPNGDVTTYDYDANGNLVRVTDPLAHARGYMYDRMDRLTNATDSVGPLASYDYDSQGRLTTITDPDGVATTFDYDPRGWTTNETRAGRSWTIARDDEGVPVGRATPLGYGNVHETDGLGMVTGIVDALNQAYAYERDGMGRVVRSENPLGHVRTRTYDGLGRLVSRTDPAVGTASYVRNGLGLIVAFTNFNGETWTRGYTAMGRLTAVTNPLGNATEFSYDTMGRLERTDYADGTHTALTYDETGRVLTRRDRGGYIHSYGYDQAGRLASVTNPAGGVADYSHNPDGTVATWTDADVGVYTRGYDAARRLASVTAPDGTVTRYMYDAFSRVTNSIDPRGHARSYEYDADGRLIRSVDPLAHARGYAYDAMGRATNVTDRLGNAYRYEYDAIGRLVRESDPEGTAVEYVYDAANRRTAMTVGGRTWRYGYDNQGKRTSQTTPLGRTTTYGRDAFGSVVDVTDPAGRTTVVQRDELQRVTGVVDPLGRTLSFEYEARGLLAGASNAISGADYAYDDLGRLETLTDPNGGQWALAHTDMGRLQSWADPLSRSRTQTWDERGRLEEVTYADGRSVAVGYDAVGNVTNRTYTDGTRIEYEYDALNRLVRTAGTTEEVSFAYDAEGRMTATENPGVVFGATYDRAGRLKTATYSNGTFAVTYVYDTAGLLTSVSDGLTRTVLTFRYDADRRLVGVARPNGVGTIYTWDDAGRIVRIQDGSVLDLRYALDAAGQVIRAQVKAPMTAAPLLGGGTEDDTFDAAAQVSTAGHAFDARGRQTAAPGFAYTWNDASRLVAIDDGLDGLDNLACNGLGYVVTRSRGGETTRVYYNYAIGMNPVVAERRDGTGQFLRYYVWTPGGRLLYMIDAADGNKVYHYHFDRTGSALALTDAAGDVTDAYAYSPYGRLVGRSGSSGQPFTYSGRFGMWREGVSELYCTPVRYYDAAAGRFLSRDPIWPLMAQVNSLNPYQFGLLNPLRYGDPQGASALSWDSLFGRGGVRGFGWSHRCTLAGSVEYNPPEVVEPLGPWEILGQMGKAFAQYLEQNPDSPLLDNLSREQRFQLLMTQFDIILAELDDGGEDDDWLKEFERQMEDFTSEHRDPFYRELDRAWKDILQGAGLPLPERLQDKQPADDALLDSDPLWDGSAEVTPPPEPLGPWGILGHMGRTLGEFVVQNPDSALAQRFTREQRFQMLMHLMDATIAGLDDGGDDDDWLRDFERQVDDFMRGDEDPFYRELDRAWKEILREAGLPAPEGTKDKEPANDPLLNQSNDSLQDQSEGRFDDPFFNELDRAWKEILKGAGMDPPGDRGNEDDTRSRQQTPSEGRFDDPFFNELDRAWKEILRGAEWDD